MTPLNPTLSLAQARAMTERAIAAADAMHVSCSVAVTDASGGLLTFLRHDGAFPGSVELAIDKAFTAAIFDAGTDALAVLAQPGAELFGIQHSHGGRVVVFGGGVPIRIDGRIVGAVGVSGGTVAEDVAIAEAAAAVF
ncbi:GlcG/HbpS family heme-binding protein [Albimonas pacifica]|uniref:Uncharacterized conserved protein GlcG, DUF336 family n=1 Tax=Albimonas pacifica TaxID=1114924 RepID=A0A1I3CV92_9RHOB|nr:heme-binding protein [Albimonas pacifica]SFH78464.1 Uncharacterized conserved protein GlcG, DUF336 family [Albimonas pacifica]